MIIAVNGPQEGPVLVIVNVAARFVLELAGLACVGWWGATASDTMIVRVLLAVGGVAVFAVIWGRFLAPTANSGLDRRQKNIVGTLVLLVAAGTLAAAGQAALALVYAVLIVVNAGFILVLGDQVDRTLERWGPRR